MRTFQILKHCLSFASISAKTLGIITLPRYQQHRPEWSVSIICVHAAAAVSNLKWLPAWMNNEKRCAGDRRLFSYSPMLMYFNLSIFNKLVWGLLKLCLDVWYDVQRALCEVNACFDVWFKMLKVSPLSFFILFKILANKKKIANSHNSKSIFLNLIIIKYNI
jgi:hypothetical protein